MADETRYSTSIDETLAQLDALHNAERATRSLWLGRLEAAVAVPPVAAFDEEGVAPLRGRRDERMERSASEPDPQPFVPLPTRTTHGGPFGASIRDRVLANVAHKGWWE